MDPTYACAARFSTRTLDLHASPIREILSVINRPGMISFAGGLPAPTSFPDWSAVAIPAECLQYGASEGEWNLRQAIAADLACRGLHCLPEQVIVISGSQQGIDLTAKLFVDAGTVVALESPTYLAAVQVFRFFGARFQSFVPGYPETLPDNEGRPALLYAIPNFQNPTGYCYTTEERHRLAAWCDERQVVLFEDDPYRDLCYETCDRRPVCSLLQQTNWVYQGSFSKSLAPGLRLGYLVVSPDLLHMMIRLKQAADLHSSRISQWLVARELKNPQRENRLQALVGDYRSRRDHFARQLDRHLGGLATWHLPLGGLFFWLTLQHPVDTAALLAAAIERSLAFMPGEAFFVAPPEKSHLRLNFSHATTDQVESGLATLAELLQTSY